MAHVGLVQLRILALAPNSVDDVRRRDWKFTAVVFIHFSSVVIATPAWMAAGFNAVVRSSSRIGMCSRVDGKSQHRPRVDRLKVVTQR